MIHSGEHTCVHCGKVFTSNVSLDKHAGRCKKKKRSPTSLPRTNTRLTRKRARHEPPNEGDNAFAEHDTEDHNVRTLLTFYMIFHRLRVQHGRKHFLFG